MKTETVIFDIIHPHPAPVNIAGLLADIEAVIKRHAILPDHAATALAVWVLHTYVFEMRDTVAYVTIESPEKRCGKTTLLSVLAAMAAKPLIASNITVGALFRSVHTCSPTLFIDEADTFMAGNGTMRGIINSGNTRRTAYVLRLAGSKKVGSLSQRERVGVRENHSNENPLPVPGEGTVGEHGTRPYSRTDSESLSPVGRAYPRAVAETQPSTSNLQPETIETGLKKYSCWCPKVIAMIGEVPDTIADRSIVVKMARKLTTETCAPLSELDTADIKAKCARFALDHSPSIAGSPKIRGDGLNDRAADTFDPLFVITRLAGEEWETKLRAAALALCSAADSENSGAGLILDILDIFTYTGLGKIFTRDLVPLLRDGGLKSQVLSPGNINEFQISKILRHYGIRPDSVRIGKEVKQGYLATDFRDALHRYVSESDIKTRIKRIRHRLDLQDEARIEAQAQAAKQQALQEKLFPMMRSMIKQGKTLTEVEIKEMILKLEQEQEMADAISSSPAEKEKEDNMPV
jgi:hypothetical protein